MKGWTVVSQGSPGKTSLTVNLGLLYAMKYPEEKIVVVDFSFQKPDVASFLDINAAKDDGLKSLDDLYPLLEGFETIILEHFLTNPFAEVPNYYVIPGYIRGTHSQDKLNREQWAYFFSALKDFADMVIFDTDRKFSHLGFQYLLGETDIFFLATLPDPLLNKHTLKLFNYLGSKGRSKEIKLVLLRSVVGQAYGEKQISESLDHDVDYIVPDIPRKNYEQQVFDAKPLAFQPKHPYTIALNQIISSLDEQQIELVERRTKWSFHIPNFFKRFLNS